MPSYVSHTLMARDVYDKIFNERVSLDYLITYSLGGDLAKYSKCRRDSHNVKQDEFIYNMCDYIKINNLVNDKEIMGVLYGHITHYVMDMIMHPLIRKISKETKNVGFSNHTLIEGYIDSYLVRDKYNIRIDKYDNRKLFKGKMKKKIYNMINYTYKKTYGVKNVAWFYLFNLFLYKKINCLYKIVGINRIKKWCKFNLFIDVNKKIDMFNLSKEIKYIDYLGKECNNSLLELYDKAIDECILYIDNVNNYLNF